MFGLGNRKGVKEMKALLTEVQALLSSDGLGQEMRTYQHGFVDSTKTFIGFGETYASEGYSAAGGLAKYCHNVFVQTVEPLNKGITPMPIIVDLAEKMTYVALSIERAIDENELRDKDKIMIADAVKMAHVWLMHDSRLELLRKIEDIMTDIEQSYKAEGVVQALRNGEKYMQRLLAWS